MRVLATSNGHVAIAAAAPAPAPERMWMMGLGGRGGRPVRAESRLEWWVGMAVFLSLLYYSGCFEIAIGVAFQIVVCCFEGLLSTIILKGAQK